MAEEPTCPPANRDSSGAEVHQPAERPWYYTKSKYDSWEGPIAESHLRQMLDKGRLSAETLVWSYGMGGLTPASQVDFTALPLWPHRTEDAQTSVERGTLVRHVPSRQVRPWVRYFARMTDYCVAALMLGLLIGVLQEAGISSDVTQLDEASATPLAMLIVFLWVFAETALLATCGTTPGKWLLSEKVRDSNGHRLGLLPAFRRSVHVWVTGVGLGLPVISLVCLIRAALKLEAEGVSVWDKAGGCVVVHADLRVLRVTVAVSLLLVNAAYAAMSVLSR